MNVLLVQGTWGDDDHWWVPGAGSFADAVVKAGHTLIGATRPFLWDCDLGGVGFGGRDLKVWEGAGRHLLDYLQPVFCPQAQPKKLAIGAHSHGRQVVKFATHMGLKLDKVVLVSGPIRADVDAATPLSRGNIKELICLHGGFRDRMQILGELALGKIRNLKREDTSADTNMGFNDADHSSLLNDPAQFSRVITLL